jgi:hypothetical protein
MPSYQDWNSALVTYFTHGVARGSAIYLGITEDILEEVGRRLGLLPNTARDNFIFVVRKEIVRGSGVKLERLRGKDRNRIPNGIAFLSLCVLAAYDMGKNEEIGTSDYFSGLRALLNVGFEEEGRPKGMNFGAKSEEPLWLEWNRWLEERGFLTTAAKSGNFYINYPISQALIRGSDHRNLLKVFDYYRNSLSSDMDSSELGYFLSDHIEQLTNHLRDIFNDSKRKPDLLEVIHRSFERWQQGETTDLGSKKVFAGIYREMDRYGEVTLRLYPKQKRNLICENLCFEYEDQTYALHQERIGWYDPSIELHVRDLSKGLILPLYGLSDLTSLTLPARNFWVLIPDEFGSSDLASWGAPPLGIHFVLLIKASLKTDLETACKEGLISWEDEFEWEDEGDIEGKWLELTDCQILKGSQYWDSLQIDPKLCNGLRPSQKIGVHFSDGLKIGKSWLEGCLPKFSVVGEDNLVSTGHFKVIDRQRNHIFCQADFEQSKARELPKLEPGSYTLEISLDGSMQSFQLTVLGWDQLTPASLERQETIYAPLEGVQVRGGLI